MMEKIKIQKKIVPLLVGLLLLSNKGFAQTADTISLSQCIAIATKNNQGIKNKKLDELINDSKIKETAADLYPQAKLKGSYQYYPTVPTSLIESKAFGGPAGQYAATQLLVPQSISGTMDISWQIYNPAILAALKISKLSKVMSQTATKDKLEAVVYDVSATYLNIQINELQADLTRSNIANLKKNLDITTQLNKQGLALKSDVENLSLSVANLETVLNNQLNGINQLQYLLKIYMGISPSSPLIIEKFKDNEKATPILANIDTTCYKKRSSYLSLQQTGNLFSLERKSIKAGFLPSLNVINSYGYTGPNSEFQFLRAYNDKWYETNLIQLNLEIPLFEGFKKRNQLKQNSYKQQQNLNSLESLKYTFQMEQLNAYNSYTNYLKDVEYQTNNVALANKLYNQKLLEYKNASASLNDMISVENTLKTAQSNYLNALVNLKIAELDIKKVNGELIKNQ